MSKKRNAAHGNKTKKQTRKRPKRQKMVPPRYLPTLEEIWGPGGLVEEIQKTWSETDRRHRTVMSERVEFQVPVLRDMINTCDHIEEHFDD